MCHKLIQLHQSHNKYGHSFILNFCPIRSISESYVITKERKDADM